MIFLLVHKQNKIINASYNLQQRQETKEELLQKKKELTLAYQQSKQLSSIQTFAKEKLQMNPIKLKDANSLCKATDLQPISIQGPQSPMLTPHATESKEKL